MSRAPQLALIAVAALLAAAPLGASPSVADAATQLGRISPGDPESGFLGGVNVAQITADPAVASYVVPAGGGVITSWQHRGDDSFPGSGRLQLWRRMPPETFMLIGRSEPETFEAGVASSFPTHIPVTGGELLGMRVISESAGIYSGVSGPNVLRHNDPDSPDPAPGETVILDTAVFSSLLNVAAVLEPDCDRDELGDESQDPSVDCVAPDSQITEQPRKRTRRRRARFVFTSSEPGSSFECKLDALAFAPCSSPATFRVTRGRHTLQVRATDQTGNTDPTPDEADWKVRRKKR